jgi:hypothetical protein
MTSHKGQGTTVDSVIVYLDDRHRESMVNKTMAYVAISRARNEVNIVTNDEKGAQKAIEREYKKDVALDIKENSDVDVTNAVNASNSEQKKETSLTNNPEESNDNKKGIEGNSTSKNNDYRNIIEIEQEKHKGFYEYKFNDKELPGYEGYESKNNKLDVNDLEINEKSNTTNIIEEQITDNNNNNQQAPLISKENKNDISFGIE